MKESTSHQEVRHSYVEKLPFVKNAESSHRLDIKDQVEKCERDKKNIKREMYKFISGIKKGHKQSHHVNYNLGVFCRTAPPYVNISSWSTQGGGTINGHRREPQRGCSTPKERNSKKSTFPCRDYENEEDLKKHNFLFNRHESQERGSQNYLHAFLKSTDLHRSSIFDDYTNGGRAASWGMFQSEGLSLLGGKKLYEEIHQDCSKAGVSPRWGDPCGEFPPCGVILSGVTSSRKRLKVDLKSRALHGQNRSRHQKSSSNCSNESTKIIDQFVKSIERNQSGEKEKKEKMDGEKVNFGEVNFGAVPPEGTAVHGMNIQNLSIPDGDTIRTRRSKTDAVCHAAYQAADQDAHHDADQDASMVLQEYKQMIKDNKKMLNLLQRVMHHIELTNRSSEVNKKIEKGISTYLRKVERMVSKYREALECNDFNRTRRLHRHFRANEMVMLRYVLNYVIDLMRIVRYQCRDLRRKIEREICEVQRAIWRPPGWSLPP
ncbi:hypothetical protein C922_04748 [Plasmodium inui San Antonio 1]|uniref:Uncharacterized protein n=1 Tax=Plasmodium inui San Antonio 1 TaxID=1237626 RepID=W7A714_9APIC|nr:hypothetical protein C922_04748 [Plasmodium inui San Antonio 1]EUD64904.1 hypothetical protein C922_04748 [Plasmodium inui San Antonio 1]